MTPAERLRYLRLVLIVTGLASLGLYPLMLFWPSGWARKLVRAPPDHYAARRDVGRRYGSTRGFESHPA